MNAPVKFGIFALVSVVLTVLIGAAIANVRLEDSIGLSARFGDVTGLHTGDDVRVAGVPIGKVTAITVEEDLARVEMAVRSDLALPADTEVAVRWLNLVGQRQVDLFPGDAEDVLEDGDEITRTVSVTDIGHLLDQLGPLGQVLDPVQINRILEATVGALDGNEAVYAETLADLDTVLSALAERDTVLQQAITDYATVTGTLAERDGQIRSLVDDLVLLTEAFAESDDVLDSALTHLASTSSGLDRLLERNADELASVVDSLSDVTGVVRSRLDDLDVLTRSMPDALAGTIRGTNRGPFLSLDVVCLEPGRPPCDAPNPELSSFGEPLTDADSFGRLLLGGAR